MNDMKPQPSPSAVQPGDRLPVLRSAPISRQTLALYAGAGGDHNPLHIDIDAARRAGFDDVFPHGMLVMAYLGRMLTAWAGPTALLHFSVRFKAIASVGDTIVCSGEVVRLENGDGPLRAVIALTAGNQDGELKLSGEAIVALGRN